MSPRKPTPFVPHLTVLENREVPAVASTRLFGGVLTVACDNSATSVLVYQTATNISVSDVTTNRLWSYSASQVSRVDVFGGAGADALTSRGPANAKLVRMFGLGGADVLSGGNGREVLKGNAGADKITGGGSIDKLYGGIGNDRLHGGDGDDILIGGDGDNWLNGGAGIDTINGGAGVDTIVAIDAGATDLITTGDGDDFVWRDVVEGVMDAVDDSSAGDVIHDVDGFDNAGADTTLNGDRIPDPVPAGTDKYEKFVNRPLFSNDGPQVFDLSQGALGDCWMLAGLGAAALSNPDAIRSRVVDFGDGTYGVHLGDFFFRVDNDLVVAQPGNQSLNYTALGNGGSVWVSVMEKAYTHFRQLGADSYPSIEGGFSIDVFTQAFQSTDGEQIFFNHGPTTQMTASQITAIIREMMDGGHAPTLGIDLALPFVPLISAHQYVVLDYDLAGFTGLVSTITLYNPWGIDGMATGDANPNDGIVTITLDQLLMGVAGSFEFATVSA